MNTGPKTCFTSHLFIIIVKWDTRKPRLNLCIKHRSQWIVPGFKYFFWERGKGTRQYTSYRLISPPNKQEEEASVGVDVA